VTRAGAWRAGAALPVEFRFAVPGTTRRRKLVLKRAGGWHLDAQGAAQTTMLLQHAGECIQAFRTRRGWVGVLTRAGEILAMRSSDGRRYEHAVRARVRV
jgi:hypothetical protein